MTGRFGLLLLVDAFFMMVPPHYSTGCSQGMLQTVRRFSGSLLPLALSGSRYDRENLLY
ncbi:hypothetical protein HED54_17310 [Ochrobactrum anthropi ATCC 49188]|nr:hypothetical protein [Brucella anthropi ATCC 49188]